MNTVIISESLPKTTDKVEATKLLWHEKSLELRYVQLVFDTCT